MKRIRLAVPLAAILCIMALAAPAFATFTTHQEGRTLKRSFQLGDPALGEVSDVKAGIFLEDQNDADAKDDLLRAGDRFTKVRYALRVQIDFLRLQAQCADGRWVNLAVNEADINSGTANDVVSNTPNIRLIESGFGSAEDATRYRVYVGKSTRWSNTGRLSVWTELSDEFMDQAPVVQPAGCDLIAGDAPTPPPSPIQPASSFVALDTDFKDGSTVWTFDAPQVASDSSVIVNSRTVDLVWDAADTDNDLGTSLESNNLGYTNTTSGPVNVCVDYQLLDGASAVAGSVRLFAYDFPDTAPGRPASSPTYEAVAPATSTAGTLCFTVPAGGTIGYIGLTYDTSNGGVEGRVRFTDLRIGTRLVAFA